MKSHLKCITLALVLVVVTVGAFADIQAFPACLATLTVILQALAVPAIAPLERGISAADELSIGEGLAAALPC